MLHCLRTEIQQCCAHSFNTYALSLHTQLRYDTCFLSFALAGVVLLPSESSLYSNYIQSLLTNYTYQQATVADF
jgi:hypothetical protein